MSGSYRRAVPEARKVGGELVFCIDAARQCPVFFRGAERTFERETLRLSLFW